MAEKATALSRRFNGHFPAGPGQAVYQNVFFWILLKLRVMEVVVTTAAIRRANLQSNCHHQQTKTQCFTGRMPFLSPNQQCQSTEGDEKQLHYMHKTGVHNVVHKLRGKISNTLISQQYRRSIIRV